MKYTVLDLVQTVLSSLDSDEVNSITDTTEAFQVALIVRRVFYEIANVARLPEHHTLANLIATSSNSPVVMRRPETMHSIDWIKYDKRTYSDTDPNFVELIPLSLKEFLIRMHSLSESESDVLSFNLTVNGSDTFKVLYKAGSGFAPTCYTSFDDGTIVFDSIDTDVDTNLQSSKALAYGIKSQTFLLSDTFIPNLDPEQFNLLLNESLAVAAVELKQQQNPKAEQYARRNWIRLQKNQQGIALESYYDDLPNYGRS